jgi:phospholipid/cholesterol/gamma-HCH transport system permease protein
MGCGYHGSPAHFDPFLMEPSTPRTEKQDAADGERLRVLGAWTAGHFADVQMYRSAVAALADAPAGTAWDLREAEQIDHLGAQLLWNHWGRQWPKRLVGSCCWIWAPGARAARWPLARCLGHLYRIGATAMPITALVGFLIGVVLAYLMSQQLRKFGADAFIVDMLGIALIRELGPVLAAILIAGRSGSAITAQIGVMRVTEELDAMRVMGIAQGFGW